MSLKRSFLSFAAFLAALASSAEWMSTVHDFGAFSEEMGPVSYAFEYVNTGNSPVSILNARPSCGCTTPAFDRGAIQPGDTASVTVTYDPQGRPGRFSKFVGIEMSDGSRCKLYVKGTVVGSDKSVGLRFPVDLGMGLKLEKGVLMFGHVLKGHIKTASLDLYNQSNNVLEPSAVTPEQITAVFEPKKIQPGDQGTVLFTFDAAKEKEYGMVNDTVYLSASPLSSYLFELPAVAIVDEDFSGLSAEELDRAPVAVLGASGVDLGRVSGTASGEIELRNTGKRPLTVRRIYSGDKGISLTVSKKEIKPGKSAVIRVTVGPEAVRNGIVNARASVITDSPSAPVLSFRIVGTAE